MKSAALLLDAFFLTRPLLLVPVWGFSIFGLYRGLHFKGSNGVLIPFHGHGGFLLWTMIFSLSVASVYVLNQIADIDVDSRNQGTPLLARRKVSRVSAWITAAICAVIALCAPLCAHPALSGFSAAALLVGIAYSFPPSRLSGRVFLDFLANAAGYGIIAFGVGWYFSGAEFSAFRFAQSALPYFLLMCAGSISSTLPDYPGDKQCGKITTAVALGMKTAHGLATVCIIGALISGLIARDGIAALCAAFALPLYFLYIFYQGPRSMEATYKGGGLACMAAAVIIMPFAALPAVGIGLCTWAYFKFRHHTTYPSLIPEQHDC